MLITNLCDNISFKCSFFWRLLMVRFSDNSLSFLLLSGAFSFRLYTVLYVPLLLSTFIADNGFLPIRWNMVLWRLFTIGHLSFFCWSSGLRSVHKLVPCENGVTTYQFTMMMSSPKCCVGKNPNYCSKVGNIILFAANGKLNSHLAISFSAGITVNTRRSSVLFNVTLQGFFPSVSERMTSSAILSGLSAQALQAETKQMHFEASKNILLALFLLYKAKHFINTTLNWFYLTYICIGFTSKFQKLNFFLQCEISFCTEKYKQNKKDLTFNSTLSTSSKVLLYLSPNQPEKMHKMSEPPYQIFLSSI